MLKLLAKKGKSNKGFTLIELIVVIAIIAILALLLVPRFGSFTEDARVSNDQAATKTIERAFMSLLANGTLRVSDTSNATVSITPTGTTWTVSSNLQQKTASGYASFSDPNDLKALIVELTGNIEVQARSTHTSGWTITITPEGEATGKVS